MSTIKKIARGILSSPSGKKGLELPAPLCVIGEDSFSGLGLNLGAVAIPDLSGNANDYTQATEAKRPTVRAEIINGQARRVLEFDGVDDLLITGNVNLPPSFTVIGVWKDERALDNSIFWSYAVGEAGTTKYELGCYVAAGSIRAPRFRSDPYDVFSNQSKSAALAGYAIYLMSVRNSPGRIEARINGNGMNSSAFSPVAPTTPRSSRIGRHVHSAQHAKGRLAFLGVYGQYFDSALYGYAEGFLSEFYGIPLG